VESKCSGSVGPMDVSDTTNRMNDAKPSMETANDVYSAENCLYSYRGLQLNWKSLGYFPDILLCSPFKIYYCCISSRSIPMLISADSTDALNIYPFISNF
jgi:hypothetical protein